MHDEMLGSRGSCPGCPGWVLCGKCRRPFRGFEGGGSDS